VLTASHLRGPALAMLVGLLACARTPRSLLIVEIAAKDPGLALAQIRVRAAGVERLETGEVPQKIGLYLPSSVEGLVTAVVEGLDGGRIPIASATSEPVEIHPGETRTVTVKLMKAPGGNPPSADGGSAADTSPALDVGQGAGGSGGGGSGGGGAAGTGGAVGTGGAGVPSDFVPVEIGSYKLRPLMPDTGLMAGPSGCSQIVGVVRDFKSALEPGGHPDFEAFSGNQPTPKLVASDLGPDRKAVYSSMCEAQGLVGSSACPYGPQTTSRANFDQWYRSVDGVNKTFLVYLSFQSLQGVSQFSSSHFFPLDEAGWGNAGRDEKGKLHNFSFTTEFHLTFRYRGGESFTFTGDDDVWVFMNGKLVIDLGGLHPQTVGTFDLDKAGATVGLIRGSAYSLDLFHAERHTTASNFRIETNLLFLSCGAVN
jgi:fibro-slime domain-containing protein